MASKIEWLNGGETWPVLAGCYPASEGCQHCYACRLLATRLKHMDDFKGLAKSIPFAPAQPATDHHPARAALPYPARYHWTGEVRLLPHRLEKPLRRKKPQTYFVADKSDLFHPSVPFEYVAAVYGIIAACPQHTFILLTKHPERMAEWYRWMARESCMAEAVPLAHICGIEAANHGADVDYLGLPATWPLPNAWVGTSVETQRWADVRIEQLLQVPAAVHWLSVEPQFEKICYRARWTSQLHRNALRWIVCGAESGPRARPFDEEWARIHRDVCMAEGIPFYFKQSRRGGKLVKKPTLDGRQWLEMPDVPKPRVAVSALGAPAAASLELASPLDRLEDIARAMVSRPKRVTK